MEGVKEGVYLLQVLVCMPVFVQDEHQFLGSTEGKDGQEAPATTSDYLGNLI